MSTNFTGITFAQQKVAPSDDAIVRRAILPDGILTGCELSYSGSTLTMASGQLLICGRQIRHPSAQNWAVVDATTGYARLLLTIDLTRTSSKEVFDQVVDTIEYASAVDGFPDLEQADINGSGTRYQVVACVASLGTGGISGIVSQLGKSVVDGAGGVNFKVVGGVTLPSDPIENTIWVNTEAKITDWMFSSEQPQEASEGLVWIKTGSSSAAAFNALKKNGIYVYPISANQYISGAWVSVTAKSFIGGAWTEWLTYLYNKGDKCLTLIGDWVSEDIPFKSGASAGNGRAYKPTYNDDNMEVNGYGGSWSGIMRTQNKINLKNYKTLKLIGSFPIRTSYQNCIYVWTDIGRTAQQNVVASFDGTGPANTTIETVTVDVSSVTEDCYIGFAGYGNGPIVVREFYLE